jgi:hypothetical protein
MSAVAAICHPDRPLASAAACALPRAGDAGGIGARDAAERLQGRAAAAPAPRGAAKDPRSLELVAGRARARSDGINSKKETRS